MLKKQKQNSLIYYVFYVNHESFVKYHDEKKTSLSHSQYGCDIKAIQSCKVLLNESINGIYVVLEP